MHLASLNETDLAELRCPQCRTPLSGSPDEGPLSCQRGHRWPVLRGLPRLYEADEVQGNDRLMNVIYDRLAPLHDPAVAIALPVCGTGTEPALRRTYCERLQLERLQPRADGAPVRILEIGIGTGANVSLVRDRIPHGLDYELWGVDLAEGMLKLCRQRLKRRPEPRVRLAMADAHALPFADHSFDRVFHIGATNNYRDPDLAMAEMARVARPDTPIVVVDERLDASAPQSLYHRLMFRLVTFYDWAPRDPVGMLPPGAVDIQDEQIARFFYCLSFRMPSADAPPTYEAPRGLPASLSRRRRRRRMP